MAESDWPKMGSPPPEPQGVASASDRCGRDWRAREQHLHVWRLSRGCEHRACTQLEHRRGGGGGAAALVPATIAAAGAVPYRGERGEALEKVLSSIQEGKCDKPNHTMQPSAEAAAD